MHKRIEKLEAIFDNNPDLFNYLVLNDPPSWHSIISTDTVIS